MHANCFAILILNSHVTSPSYFLPALPTALNLHASQGVKNSSAVQSAATTYSHVLSAHTTILYTEEKTCARLLTQR